MPDHKTPQADLADSRIVMHIADRLRRRDAAAHEAVDPKGQRRALRKRLKRLYLGQGIRIEQATLDSAVKQQLAGKPAHRPARGAAAALARLYVRWVTARRDAARQER